MIILPLFLVPKSQVVSLEPLQKDFKTTTLWSTKDRLNSSQKEAMKLALTKRFQLIQGPPGMRASSPGYVEALLVPYNP